VSRFLRSFFRSNIIDDCVVDLAENPFRAGGDKRKLYVRACFPALESAFMTKARKIALLLGTAGYGKTSFAFYCIRNQVVAGRTVLFTRYPRTSTVPKYYVMDPETQSVYATTNSADKRVQSIFNDENAVWFQDGRAMDVADCSCQIRVSCSTPEAYFNEIEKLNPLILYMPEWSHRSENLEQLELNWLRTKCYPEVTEEELADSVNCWGHNPRHTLDMAYDRRQSIERLGGIIQSCTVDLVRVTVGSLLFKGDDTMHKILVTLVSSDFKSVTPTFASEHILTKLVQQWINAEHVKMLNLMVTTFDETLMATFWSHLFEAYAHNLLARGGAFKIQELFPDGSVGKESELILPARANVRFIDSPDQLNTAQIDEYVRPKKLNFATMDSLMWSFNKKDKNGGDGVDVVNIFQMTRSTHYPLENAWFSQLKKGLACYASAEKYVYLVVPGQVYEGIKWQPIVAKKAPTAADASSSSTSSATARERPPYSSSGAATLDADADGGRLASNELLGIDSSASSTGAGVSGSGKGGQGKRRGVSTESIGEHGAEPGEDMEVDAEVAENDHAAVSGIRQFKLLIGFD
jgi:hypothetical protein